MAQLRKRQFRADMLVEFEKKHGITAEGILKQQKEHNKHILKDMEKDTYDVHINAARQAHQHHDSKLHMVRAPHLLHFRVYYIRV